MTKKHLVLAVRESKSCPQGVRFVASFFRQPQSIGITLLSIASTPPSQAISTMWDGNGDALSSGISHSLETCFTVSKTYLVQRGFAEKNISAKVKRKTSGTGYDILAEGRSRICDAVVLGSRSSSLVENLVSGNIGHDILEKAIDFPIWFCRNTETDRKNVLICLDGSDCGLRVADHVGYMLQGEEHQVTLLFVDNGQNVNHETMFTDAVDILVNHGMPPGQIYQRVIESSRIVPSIINAINRGNYAAAAIGWSGRSARKGVPVWLAGSKCRAVLEGNEYAALWIVP